MSAGQAVLLVGGSLVILAVMIAVMIRLDRAHHRRRIQGRREAWNAAGSVGPCPGTGYYGPTGFHGGGGSLPGG